MSWQLQTSQEVPSDTKPLLTKTCFEILIFKKLRISRVISRKSLTKNNSQGIFFAINSCQRVAEVVCWHLNDPNRWNARAPIWWPHIPGWLDTVTAIAHIAQYVLSAISSQWAWRSRQKARYSGGPKGGHLKKDIWKWDFALKFAFENGISLCSSHSTRQISLLFLRHFHGEGAV